MLEVLHVPTGQPYDVADYQSLDDYRRPTVARDLVCMGCGARAHFRRAAGSGRSACFFSRPHQDDCDLATVRHLDVDEPGSVVIADHIVNSGDMIVFDFAAPLEPATITATSKGGSSHRSRDRVARQYTGPSQTAVSQRQSLRAVLRYGRIKTRSGSQSRLSAPRPAKTRYQMSDLV